MFGGGIIPDAGHPQAEGAGGGRGLHARRPDGVITDWLTEARHGRRGRPSDRTGAWTSSSTRASSSSPASASPSRRERWRTTVDEAVAAAERVGYPVVVKAQVQVGGRGKAGGIKLAADADEVRTHAEDILGMDIKGHAVRVVWIEHASRHRRGVLRQLHPRPVGQAAPRHALGPGRRRHRAGGRRRTRTPSPASTSTRSTGSTEATRPRAGSRRPASTRTPTDGAVDILLKLYSCLRRGRRRPGRDQPADPHAGRPGARPRRQGHARRQRRLPPPRVRASYDGHPGARRAGDAWPTTRACSTSGSTARSASSPTAPGWP